jgi:hypothetical protein
MDIRQDDVHSEFQIMSMIFVNEIESTDGRTDGKLAERIAS